ETDAAASVRAAPGAPASAPASPRQAGASRAAVTNAAARNRLQSAPEALPERKIPVLPMLPRENGERRREHEHARRTSDDRSTRSPPSRGVSAGANETGLLARGSFAHLPYPRLAGISGCRR